MITQEILKELSKSMAIPYIIELEKLLEEDPNNEVLKENIRIMKEGDFTKDISFMDLPASKIKFKT